MPSVETYCSGKKKSFQKYYYSLTGQLVTQELLMEMYDEVNVVYMPVNKTSILQTLHQELILTSRSYYVNKFTFLSL